MNIAKSIQKFLAKWLMLHTDEDVECYRKCIGDLREEVEESMGLLRKMDAELKKERVRGSSGQACVEAVLGTGILWYDYDKLSYDEKVSYKANIDAALANEALENEMNHYKTELIKHIAQESRDFAEVMQLRSGICVLETLRDRLRMIPDPRTHEQNDDPYAAI